MNLLADTQTTHDALPESARISINSVEPIKRMVAEALDHQLLIFAQTQQEFTVSDVRDALINLPELEGLDPAVLRYRVRDRLRTLERHGLAYRVGVHGKNRPLYRLHLEASPSPDVTEPSPNPNLASPPSNSLADYLKEERKRLRTDMQVILAEADHYDTLLQRFPDERDRIAPLITQALSRGGELKGMLDANIRLRNALLDEERRA
ncbi:hypothetical protein HNO52_11445 [Billgrantia diversa]|uniref:hypothetical protein n=1 Tax=Halomonas sp. MCCC 1A13316 TaxID=2733487 RepID=UPI0018A5116B|nr:hypothetical protein [Halomonas sp. MCCC 1A13316]QOR39059.1 hypothetical protein HNO52_11445 [Halomonas sp. MCCC 1A13316]